MGRTLVKVALVVVIVLGALGIAAFYGLANAGSIDFSTPRLRAPQSRVARAGPFDEAASTDAPRVPVAPKVNPLSTTTAAPPPAASPTGTEASPTTTPARSVAALCRSECRQINHSKGSLDERQQHLFDRSMDAFRKCANVAMRVGRTGVGGECDAVGDNECIAECIRISQGSGAPNKTAASPNASTPKVAATSLIAAYEDNEAAADEKYLEKRFVITGTVSAVNDQFVFMSGDGLGAAYRESEAAAVKKLHRGQRVAVECTILGSGIAGIVADDCALAVAPTPARTRRSRRRWTCSWSGRNAVSDARSQVSAMEEVCKSICEREGLDNRDCLNACALNVFCY